MKNKSNSMKKKSNKKIEQELAALVQMGDANIDTSDIPEVRDWTGDVIGKFYRPVKEAVSLRIDADVLTWFRTQGPGYQTRINDLLRSAMTAAWTNPRAVQSAEPTRQSRAMTGIPGVRCRTFHYPGLERRGETQRWSKVAGSIAERRCLFPAAQ
jgi:uncharacterized protein (DUF4415 family)